MARKSNTRKKKKQSPLAYYLGYIKGFAATVSIVALSALGLWRCLDNEPQQQSEKKSQVRMPVERVDVGAGHEADPTLINENQLLKEEVGEEFIPEPETGKEGDKASDEEVPETPAPEKRFPLFGVAFHFHAQFRAGPSFDSRVIGYARRGATFRLSERLSTDGCSRGWYEVSPGALFVCNGAGIIIDDEPVTFAPSPPQPRLSQPLPYNYAYANKDGTPEYWRIPTVEETAQVASFFERLSSTSDLEHPMPNPGDAVAGGEQATGPSEENGVVISTDANAVVVPTPTELADAGAPATPSNALPPYVHLRMAKGYFVSTDEKIVDGDREFRRTVRGRYIPEERLFPAAPSDFEGFLVSESNPLPRAFVVGGGVSLLRQEGENGPLSDHEKVTRLSMFDYLGEMTRRNRRYVQVGEGLFLSSRVTAVAKPSQPPADLEENERWIHIDLSEQTLVAYEGTRPVFATLVSTGRPGFETPTGTYRIYAKHVTVTMDDTEAGEEAYSIEDVPWVQYFKDSFALHGAFWHNRFGRVKSHGCVNLSPKDAMRLFKWTGPHVPDGVHGIFATKENAGTRVVIEP